MADFEPGFYGSVQYKSDGMIRDGLIECGHTVLDYSYRALRSGGKDKMYGRILKTIFDFPVEMMLLAYGDGIDLWFLDKVRAVCPGVRIAYWYGDAAIEPWVKELARKSDVFFCTTGGELLKQLVEEGVAKTAFFPNLVNPALYTPGKKDLGSIIFTGGDYGEPLRRESVYVLTSARHDFVVYGWGSGRIVNPEYAERLSVTDMGLAVSAFHDRPKMQSSRTLEYMASGICTFVKRVPNLDDLLGQDGRTYVGFDDPKELPELVTKYSYVSRMIGTNAREYVVENYDYQKIANYILDETFGASTEMYGKWVETYGRDD